MGVFLLSRFLHLEQFRIDADGGVGLTIIGIFSVSGARVDLKPPKYVFSSLRSWVMKSSKRKKNI